MRVALCFSGLPREIAECWRTLQFDLFANLDNPDVFIHSGEPYPVGPEFFTVFKPKKYGIEKQVRHEGMEALLRRIGYFDEGSLLKTIQQMFGLKRVWDYVKEYERETGAVYDLVVRVRPDLLFLKPVTLDLIDPTRITTLHPGNDFLVSSEFAIGPYSSMQKYFGIFDWVLNNEAAFTRDHHRLICTPDNLYHNDILFTIYILDHCGFKFADPKFSGLASDYYRIMGRHKKNEYLKDPSTFFHFGPACSDPQP